jgi:tetratricopeptide (TPR) repeat protein
VGATFVGRDHELAAVAQLRARAAGGRRQLVMVTGEGGIGKTWFCEQVSEAARADGFEVVWGRCWPHGGAPALWPWPTMLPKLIGEQALLEADGDNHVGPERFARFAAIAERLTSTRAGTPTMIVIDDLHHADESALLLTRFLTGTLDRLPLVIILVRRPGSTEAETLLGELQADATTIPLRPFTLEDTTALLAAHGQPIPGRAAVTTLLRVTGGSPLYLARAIDLGWTRTGPATVQHAIAAAIARLSQPQRHVLALAALLGVDGTVSELAQLAGKRPAEVIDAMAAATEAGLVNLTKDGIVFHDLVRESALAELDSAQLLDAHASAAALLTGNPERVAHHALAAAVRSPADAEVAIAACRNAAASLRKGFAYEPAADLLSRAVALTANQHPELLVERADAVLACGRLNEARAAFEIAAEHAADPVLLARAVLGFGGVWVHEHRNAAVRQQMFARQRRALDTLPDNELSLRCRLSVRLAAEAVYEGDDVSVVLDALAETRKLGDHGAIAEALSLTHHAMLGPEHAIQRLELAEEQIAVASSAGDGILALFGELWRTTDLYLLGDPRADRSLTELRQRSATLGVATTGYIVACMDVMRLIRAGRLDEAEAAAEPCLKLGLEVGDADALGYYGGQLLTIRWLQGRDGELADLVAETLASATLTTVEYAFRASAVSVLAHAGRLTEARAALAPLRELGLANIPRSSTWLAAMGALVEAAAQLDDADLAEEAADELRPFADLPVMASLAVSCFGAVSRSLGVAALTMGDPDTAVAYFEHAVATNVRLDNRPATAVSRGQLAEALIARGRHGDIPRARALLVDAAKAARLMHMPMRAEIWQATAAALTPSSAPATLRRRGRDGWTLHSGQSARELPDLVGLDYLAQLLENSGHDLTAMDLAGATAVTGRQDLLDSSAVDAYRQRVRELAGDIDDAEADADLVTAERLRLERDALSDELAKTFGLGGRMRGFSSTPEQARTAVRKAIKRAIDAIAAADPVLGDNLRSSISTGTVCRFTPTGSRPWQVTR